MSIWKNTRRCHIVDGQELKSGHKEDNGKERFDLFPPEAMFALARILTFGATKYEDRNWERGILYGRVFAALQRHLWKWWMWEDTDEETRESHMAHALCCIVFLVTYETRGGNRSKWDDRSQWIFDYALTCGADNEQEHLVESLDSILSSDEPIFTMVDVDNEGYIDHGNGSGGSSPYNGIFASGGRNQ